MSYFNGWKKLKNELARINDVMITSTNISSVKFISTHTPPIKSNGIFRSYKKASITCDFTLLYINYIINLNMNEIRIHLP